MGEPTRFVTWNLYVFTLAGRIQPVVDELMRPLGGSRGWGWLERKQGLLDAKG